MPFNMGGPEMLIVLVVVLIVFGAGKLPNVMKDLGTGLREFKRAQTEPDAAPGAAGAAPDAQPQQGAPPVTSPAGELSPRA